LNSKRQKEDAFKVAQKSDESQNQTSKLGKENENDLEDLGIEITLKEDGRSVRFGFRGEEYSGCFLELPCCIDVQKTLDKSNYFKSGEISQMLLIHDPNEEIEPELQYDQETFKLDDGITPPTRNIRKRKFKKGDPEEKRRLISRVELEVLKMTSGNLPEDEDEDEYRPSLDFTEGEEEEKTNFLSRKEHLASKLQQQPEQQQQLTPSETVSQSTPNEDNFFESLFDGEDILDDSDNDVDNNDIGQKQDSFMIYQQAVQEYQPSPQTPPTKNIIHAYTVPSSLSTSFTPVHSQQVSKVEEKKKKKKNLQAQDEDEKKLKKEKKERKKEKKKLKNLLESSQSSSNLPLTDFYSSKPMTEQ